MNLAEEITKKASKTFWMTARVFPKQVREDTFVLYAYVRTIDDLADLSKPNLTELENYYRLTRRAFSGEITGNQIIDEFTKLATRNNFSRKWVWDFLDTQKRDAKKKVYKTQEEIDRFVYGVAEVIGLFMCRIMDLPQEAYKTARLLGGAMQQVNILRDLREDYEMGKIYIAGEVLKKYGLRNPGKWEEGNRLQIERMIKSEIKKTRILLEEAGEGLKFISQDYRLPVAAVRELYIWVTEKIEEEPELVYKTKVKPGVGRIAWVLAKHFGMRLAKRGIYAI